MSAGICRCPVSCIKQKSKTSWKAFKPQFVESLHTCRSCVCRANQPKLIKKGPLTLRTRLGLFVNGITLSVLQRHIIKSYKSTHLFIQPAPSIICLGPYVSSINHKVERSLHKVFLPRHEDTTQEDWQSFLPLSQTSSRQKVDLRRTGCSLQTQTPLHSVSGTKKADVSSLQCHPACFQALCAQKRVHMITMKYNVHSQRLQSERLAITLATPVFSWYQALTKRIEGLWN